MFHAKDLLGNLKLEARHVGHIADRGFANQSRRDLDWDFTWLTAKPFAFYIVPEGSPAAVGDECAPLRWSLVCADIRVLRPFASCGILPLRLFDLQRVAFEGRAHLCPLVGSFLLTHLR